MATTIHIESEIVETSATKPLSTHIMNILQICDTCIDKVQEMLLTLSFFQKDPSVDYHLNLLLETNEHESSCESHKESIVEMGVSKPNIGSRSHKSEHMDTSRKSVVQHT